MNRSTSFTVHHPFTTFELHGRLNSGTFEALPPDSTAAPIWTGKYVLTVTGDTATVTFFSATSADVGEFFIRALAPDLSTWTDSVTRQLTATDLTFTTQPTGIVIGVTTAAAAAACG